METEISISYIYIYYTIWLSRAEKLSLTVLKVRLRKITKIMINVKKISFKISGEVGSSSDGFLCVVASREVICFSEKEPQTDMLVTPFKQLK